MRVSWGIVRVSEMSENRLVLGGRGISSIDVTMEFFLTPYDQITRKMNEFKKRDQKTILSDVIFLPGLHCLG